MGKNIHHYRRLLWSNVTAIAVSRSHILWIVMGDFITVRFTQEKLGGRQQGIHQLQDFNDCIAHCSFIIMKCTGNFWSWHNKAIGQRRIIGRLDRILCNDIWMATIPHSSYEYLSKSTSDHSPVLLHLHQQVPAGPKPFRFFS